MAYYEWFGLTREPFSTSPDPDFFYYSREHNAALKRLEISIRLKRGLSLITGDVGTGKTTLCRRILRQFQYEKDFVFHMILDPAYDSPKDFVADLARRFGIKSGECSTLGYKEALERYLLKRGVDEGKTLVLLLDEGQKLSAQNLELLRTLLNFETNEFKLLQIVIFAQMEFMDLLKPVTNFTDRIAMKHVLGPISEEETSKMIQYRLEIAGARDPGGIFTPGSIRLIHELSGGYPRRIAMLSHDALEHAVMMDSRLVTMGAVGSPMLQEAAL